MKPSTYRAAARRITALAQRLEATAAAETPRQRGARTRIVNLMAQEARRLYLRNAEAAGDAELSR